MLKKIYSFILQLQYQRWLYPVDKSRMDDGRGEFTESDATAEDKNAAQTKKNK